VVRVDLAVDWDDKTVSEVVINQCRRGCHNPAVYKKIKKKE
jgi:hypothetical protein